MDDPELHDNETVLMRTSGVFVKSIPFEGILTDQRIILVDRAKNLLPPKEIPFETIKDAEPGENAIRDQTITVSVLARNNAVRQVILTFPRVAGGNRIKERDEWVQLIQKYRTKSLGQSIRRSVAGLEPVPVKKTGTKAPKIEIISSQRVTPKPLPEERAVASPDAVRRERPRTVPSPSPALPPVTFGTFCTRCGNRVPDGSLFCNRCGTRVIVPADMESAVPQRPSSVPKPELRIEPADVQPGGEAIAAPEIPKTSPPATKITREPMRGSPSEREPEPIRIIPGTPPPDISQPPTASREPAPEAFPVEKPKNGFLSRIFPPKKPQKQPSAPSPDISQLPTTPREPAPEAFPVEKPKNGFLSRIFPPKKPQKQPSTPSPEPLAAPPEPEKRRGGMRRSIAIGIAVVLVIAVIAGIFIFVKPSFGTGTIIPAIPSGTTTPAGVATATPADGSTDTIVRTETSAVSIPATAVSVHVNYIGGWKGTYGLSSALQTMTSSGDRIMNVENAAGIIQASFAKQDGSSHEILVEIYKDGKLLTKGTTSIPNGKVTLSVDTTTGIAQAPVITGAGATAVTTTARP